MANKGAHMPSHILVTGSSRGIGAAIASALRARGAPRLLAEVPLGRVASADEIASVAAFCALDAPPSMTGASIDVNGASFVR